MGTVQFSRMDQGTVEDWEIIGRYDDQVMRELPDQLLAAVDALEHTYGFRVTRKEHSLQSATRAHADGRSEETWSRRSCMTSGICSPRSTTGR